MPNMAYFISRNKDNMEPKEIIWVGSAKKDIMSLSDSVKRVMGYALRLAQMGFKHDDAKVLKGFHGATVIEIIADDEAGTYRGVYTTGFKEVIFILHVLQKKSKSGIATPKKEIDLIEARLKQAEEIYREYYKTKNKK